MRTMKNNILGIGFAALFFLSFGAPALGAETAVASSPVPAAEAKSVKCDLDVRAKALTDFLGQEAEDSEKKAEQELVLRQELLQSVLAARRKRPASSMRAWRERSLRTISSSGRRPY